VSDRLPLTVDRVREEEKWVLAVGVEGPGISTFEPTSHEPTRAWTCRKRDWNWNWNWKWKWKWRAGQPIRLSPPIPADNTSRTSRDEIQQSSCAHVAESTQ